MAFPGDSMRPKIAQTGAALLFLVFLLGAQTALLPRFFPPSIGYRISGFLSPGFKNHPDQWLSVQTATLACGIAGLLLFALGRSGGRWPLAAGRVLASVHNNWRQVIWAILLGLFGERLLLSATVISPLGFGDHGLWGFGRMAFYSYGLPLVGLYACARLLFAKQRWAADTWAGYAMAALTLFSLGWQVLFSGSFVLKSLLFSMGDPFDIGRGLSFGLSLASDCAAAWAGLLLARGRHPDGQLMAKDRSRLGYLVLSALTVGIAISKLRQLAFIVSSLATTHAAIYGSQLIALVVVALACVVDSVAVAGRQAEAPAARPAAAPGSTRKSAALAFAPLATARFWKDLALSFVITGILVLGVYAAFRNSDPYALPFTLPIFLMAGFAGPVLMFVIGVMRGRAGAAIAPMLVVLLAFGYARLSWMAHEHEEDAAIAEAAKLNVFPFAAPTRSHDTVVIEDSNESRSRGDCAGICQQILLASDYAVAVAMEGSQEWRVHRRAHGHALCADPEHADSYVAFLALGIAGTCIDTVSRQGTGDALVIRENRSRDTPIRQQLPKRLNANILEFYELLAGQYQLLGRVVSAAGSTSGQGDDPSIMNLRDDEFYAMALKLSIAREPAPRDGDLGAAALVLESLFQDAAVGEKARFAFTNLGKIAKSDAAMQPLRDAVRKLWDSGDPELVVLAFRALHEMRQFSVDFAKPAVIAFMAAENDKVADAAVGALMAFDADLEFAKAPLGDLILSERFDAHRTYFQGFYHVVKKIDGPFPRALQERARRAVVNASDRKPERLLLDVAVAAHTNKAGRQGALDWIFDIEGERFEQVVQAIGVDSEVICCDRATALFWSEDEMAQIVRRAAQVPSERLIAYVEPIRWQMALHPYSGELRDLFESRIEQLDVGSEADRTLAATLQAYLDKVGKRW